eukprot:gnl/TRDRNA2_/TRDRNA2_185345_c0_seq1.p1 gnl/TRDRNA2_/TRDRNA2_185345_c0~~gnl/TRDRNA2_/TRDRNA2_185345_c0_seq1.p1  ORF type:complete len:475 (+),score=108.56 gnl/TRDRNA2_/TRDRNA2_185345_c0_seq1:32-1456(+)
MDLLTFVLCVALPLQIGAMQSRTTESRECQDEIAFLRLQKVEGSSRASLEVHKELASHDGTKASGVHTGFSHHASDPFQSAQSDALATPGVAVTIPDSPNVRAALQGQQARADPSIRKPGDPAYVPTWKFHGLEKVVDAMKNQTLKADDTLQWIGAGLEGVSEGYMRRAGEREAQGKQLLNWVQNSETAKTISKPLKKMQSSFQAWQDNAKKRQRALNKEKKEAWDESGEEVKTVFNNAYQRFSNAFFGPRNSSVIKDRNIATVEAFQERQKASLDAVQDKLNEAREKIRKQVAEKSTDLETRFKDERKRLVTMEHRKTKFDQELEEDQARDIQAKQEADHEEIDIQRRKALKLAAAKTAEWHLRNQASMAQEIGDLRKKHAAIRANISIRKAMAEREVLLAKQKAELEVGQKRALAQKLVQDAILKEATARKISETAELAHHDITRMEIRKDYEQLAADQAHLIRSAEVTGVE